MSANEFGTGSGTSKTHRQGGVRPALKGEHFLEYQLVPMAVAALPEEELFPAMRAQLATFEPRTLYALRVGIAAGRIDVRFDGLHCSMAETG